mmetsp:Transcript_10752/g.24031  ORF Transcript_10752/g.24031 Transcript_10752/m.24031 type:complete len:83 (+) Transcript_10752:2567-2815(+)
MAAEERKARTTWRWPATVGTATPVGWQSPQFPVPAETDLPAAAAVVAAAADAAREAAAVVDAAAAAAAKGAAAADTAETPPG